MTRFQAAVAVGEVLESEIPVIFLAWTRILDPGDDLFRADVVRKLGDDDAGLAGVQLLDLGGGPHLEDATACGVRLADAFEADDVTAGGQVGPGTYFMSCSRLASGCLSR